MQHVPADLACEPADECNASRGTGKSSKERKKKRKNKPIQNRNRASMKEMKEY
jgi:hypothetical protein